MTSRYRIAFFMQQVLGHVTHSANFERIVREDPDVDPVWVPVTFWREGGWLERASFVPPNVAGTVRALQDVWGTRLRQRVDGLVFNTPVLATSVTGWMAKVPTAISLDVTPRQFDNEGVFFDHQPDGDGPVARWKHSVNRSVVKRSAVLAPWSSWVQKSLVDDYGAPPEKIDIIPPGVDLAAWQHDSRVHRDLPRLLFVGGDFKRKGGDALVEWFVKRGRGRCELAIVSRDPALAALQAPDIRVERDFGPNSSELRRLYAESDIMVLPSRSEPFGIAAVEALAAGLPAVVTRVGGLTDIVDDGVTGYLISPDDATALDASLERLIASPQLRAGMGQAGRRVAEERFDAEKNGQRMLSLVKGMVDSSRARAPRAAAAHAESEARP